MKYDKLCRCLGALFQGEDPYALASPFLNISPTGKLETFWKAHPASILHLTTVKQLSLELVSFSEPDAVGQLYRIL